MYLINIQMGQGFISRIVCFDLIKRRIGFCKRNCIQQYAYTTYKNCDK